MENVGVVIPTKNRPEKLEYCLTALARAREKLPFVVDVGDSSDTAKTSEAVRAVCKKTLALHATSARKWPLRSS